MLRDSGLDFADENDVREHCCGSMGDICLEVQSLMSKVANKAMTTAVRQSADVPHFVTCSYPDDETAVDVDTIRALVVLLRDQICG